MSSPRQPLSSRPSFLPDEISRREFATVFRGYDPAEVRTFLNQLSEQASELGDRLAAVQRSLSETEDRVKNPELDEETVTRLLGEQTAQILRSAREAANDTRARADAEVSRSLREAHEVTSKMREEAETLLAERTEEAERMAALVRTEAAEAADLARSQANEEAARIRAEIAAEAEKARADLAEELRATRAHAEAELDEERNAARKSAQDLIDTARAEAQALVERTQSRQDELIEGLIRKRKIALAQVEELRAGRQRLLKAYKLVRGTLDEVTQELERVEEEARQAASLAGVRAAQNADLVPEDLDASIELENYTLSDDVSEEIIDLIAEERPRPGDQNFDVASTESPSSAASGPSDDDGTDSNGPSNGGPTLFDAEANGGMDFDPASETVIDIHEAEVMPEQVASDGSPSRGASADARTSSVATLERQDIQPLEAEMAEDDDDYAEEADDEAAEATAQNKPRQTSSSFIIGESVTGGVSAEMDRNLQMRRDAAVGKSRSQASRRLGRVLQDEQEAVVARMRAGDAASIQALLGSTEDQAATYHRAVVKLFREVVRMGASSVEGSKGVERGVIDRTGSTAARTLASQLVDDLRSQLEPVLEELLSVEAPDSSTLHNLIAAPYEAVRGEYLDQLVDDRIGGAFDQGVHFAR